MLKDVHYFRCTDEVYRRSSWSTAYERVVAVGCVNIYVNSERHRVHNPLKTIDAVLLS